MKRLLNGQPVDARTAQVFDLYINAPIAMNTFIGEDLIVDFINPRMLELWDRKYEEVINKPLEEALPESKGQWFIETFKQIYSEGIEYKGQEVTANLNRNGKMETAYFNVVYRPIWSDDKIIGVVQVATEVTELVLQRKQVEKNEELLRVALDAGRMGNWQVDLINKEIIRSRLHDQIFGYADGTNEWNYQIFYKHIHPDFQQYVIEKISESLSTGTIELETKILWNDKSVHWVMIKGVISFDSINKPVLMTGIIMDITEQKDQAERETKLAAINATKEEANKQNEQLRKFLHNAPAPIAILKGPEHIFNFVNIQYQEKFFPGRSLVDKPVIEALPELKDSPIIDVLDEVYKTGKPFVGNEYPLEVDRGKNQLELTYFNFIYEPTYDLEGNINGVFAIAYEVTEQVNARKAAERSEHNLKLALEAGKMGTWSYDFDTEELFRSEQYDMVFGYKKRLKSWTYNDLLMHIAPEEREAAVESFQKYKTTGTLDFETRIIGDDKETRWIALKGKTLKEEGKSLKMVGVVSDITELKKSQTKLEAITKELATTNEELVASNEELMAANEQIHAGIKELEVTNKELSRINSDLDNFVYTASHDLKAPIANIEGLVRLVSANLSPDSRENEKIKKTLPLIDASIERFKKTINALTDITKLQKEEEETKLLNLLDIVKEVELDLMRHLEESTAQIDIEVSPELHLDFSYKNLKSIFYNLISNAIKYRSPDRTPKIRIKAYQQPQNLVFEVTDNGLGINVKDQSKVFSMFKRLHNHVEGSGIGLYIVKKIVDNAEGRIEVESTVGRGTTFKVVLPVEK